jgi:FG-GAP-like repeat
VLAFRIGYLRTRRQGSHAWFRACSGLLLVALSLAAFPHCAGADTRPSEGPSLPVQSVSRFAIADFDGDSRPDIASVQVGQAGSRDSHYLIDFRLTSGLPQTIGVTAPAGGLQLTSRDVNGDTYPDVVVTTLLTDRPVAVLLNDGRGNFTQSEPSAFPEAFTNYKSSFGSAANAIRDATVGLFSRYVPGDSHESTGTPSLPRVVGRPAPGAFHLLTLLSSASSLGRAPPLVAASSLNH